VLQSIEDTRDDALNIQALGFRHAQAARLFAQRTILNRIVGHHCSHPFNRFTA
jgi:hypothetical protein